jgi:putative hydrolase of the HAD superfamily
MMKKTISFDLWNTLIIPNKEFKKSRLNLCVLYSGKSEKECAQILQNVKNDLDIKSELFGFQFKPDTAMFILCNELGLNSNEVTNFKLDYYQLFRTYTPIILPGVLETLKRLKAKYRIVLASNTVMIPGKIICNSLYSEFLELFDDMYFSDEIGVSKPNPLFFQKIHIGAECIARNIIHIGDNRSCDIDGALAYGMHTIEIKAGCFPLNLETTIDQIMNRIEIYKIQ